MPLERVAGPRDQPRPAIEIVTRAEPFTRNKRFAFNDLTVRAPDSDERRLAARALGYLEAIEATGAIVLEGVCFYILQNIGQIRVQNGWSNLVTNSAKLANIIGAHKFNTILRRTDDCVRIALTGEDR